ncbi:MAG TPA: rhodanese-like domain-containing protein [Saprospiraceae bacterium]|nr:rhodanese-like domain-containing protein [Saprospiraceae bacterium]
MKPAKEICPTTTMGKIKEGALIVDVRSPKEVKTVTFDVPNYVNIPLDQLEERIHEIPKDKDVVFVDKTGTKSLKATYFLMNAGYENVYNMKDGLVKWVAKKFPTKGDTASLFVIGDFNSDCC